jgi:hypothetical protein
MLGNGPGQSSEDDNGKKLYGSLSMDVADGMTVEGYADFNMRPGDQNQRTVKGLLAIKKENFSGGLEAFSRTNNKAAAGKDVTITGLSAFATLPLSGQLKGFGRLDMVNNDATDATDKLVIVGWTIRRRKTCT